MKKILHHPHIYPILLFVILYPIYFSSTVGTMNAVDAPQYALTRAIVDYKTTKIDNLDRYTYTDISIVNGHKFNPREPGQSLLAIPFYILAKVMLPFTLTPYQGYSGTNQESKLEASTYGLFSLFAVLSVIMLYYLCRKLKSSRIASFITSLLIGLGSLLFRYSAGFVRQPLLAFLFLAFIYTASEGKNNTKLKLIFLGIITGFASTIESYCLILIPFGLVYIFFTYFRIHKSKIITNVIIYIVAILISISPKLIYDKISFNKFFTDSGFFIGYSHPYTLQNLFIVDAYKTLPYLLFSTTGLPSTIFGYFDKLPKEISKGPNESSYWAARNRFLGIFPQSPVLIFIIPGFYFFYKKNRFMSYLSFSIIFIYTLLISKFPFFWNPTAYDSRYLLPIVPLLFIPLSFWFDYLFKKNKSLEKILLFLITLILSALSVYNAWYSMITNFAPHVTGEHKFSFNQLYQPWYISFDFMKKNIWMLFINTFPNIYNLHLIVIVVLSPIFLTYFVHSVFLIILKKPERVNSRRKVSHLRLIEKRHELNRTKNG